MKFFAVTSQHLSINFVGPNRGETNKINREVLFMSYQFNFDQKQKLSHKVTLKELDSVRAVLLKASYELLEIKHIDGQHVSEIWQKIETKEQFYLEIIPDEQLEDCEPEATLQTVVDELVDLWVELRAIRRNTLSDYNEDDNFLFPREPLKPLELFWQNVDYQREMRNDDPGRWSFLFNPSIDEYVCAYNDLDTIDQKAITH